MDWSWGERRRRDWRCGSGRFRLAARTTCKVRHWLADARKHRWCRGFRRSLTASLGTAFLDHLLKNVALFGIEAAQLVLNIKTRLLTKIEQILALHIQLAGQDVNSYFLSLQAILPGRTLINVHSGSKPASLNSIQKTNYVKERKSRKEDLSRSWSAGVSPAIRAAKMAALRIMKSL